MAPSGFHQRSNLENSGFFSSQVVSLFKIARDRFGSTFYDAKVQPAALSDLSSAISTERPGNFKPLGEPQDSDGFISAVRNYEGKLGLTDDPESSNADLDDAVKMARAVILYAYKQRESSIYSHRFAERDLRCNHVALPAAAKTYQPHSKGGKSFYLRPVRRSQFARLANALGLVGEGAEIGVYRGENAEIILSQWQGRKLYLVDAWDAVDIWDASAGASNFNLMMTRLKPYEDRIHILKNLTYYAADRVADESLDFIYVDAGHDYLSVRRDLNAWYPKLRKGGLMSGHDYYNGYSDIAGNIVYGVRDAVDEFAEVYNLRVYHSLPDIELDSNTLSWYFLKC